MEHTQNDIQASGTPAHAIFATRAAVPALLALEKVASDHPVGMPRALMAAAKVLEAAAKACRTGMTTDGQLRAIAESRAALESIARGERL